MTATELLAEMRGLLGCTRAQALERLGADEADVQAGAGYQAATDVDWIRGTSLDLDVYLRGGDVALVYGDLDGFGELSADALRAELTGPGERLASRTGRGASLHLHADDGVAFAEEGGLVQLVEVFAPMSAQEYRERIYVEPPTFTR
jgi:hypothetical protein